MSSIGNVPSGLAAAAMVKMRPSALMTSRPILTALARTASTTCLAFVLARIAALSMVRKAVEKDGEVILLSAQKRPTHHHLH